MVDSQLPQEPGTPKSVATTRSESGPGSILDNMETQLETTEVKTVEPRKPQPTPVRASLRVEKNPISVYSHGRPIGRKPSAYYRGKKVPWVNRRRWGIHRRRWCIDLAEIPQQDFDFKINGFQTPSFTSFFKKMRATPCTLSRASSSCSAQSPACPQIDSFNNNSVESQQYLPT